MKKVAIVGAGNAASITALEYYLVGKIRTNELEDIEIYYDPNAPIERVGQGALPNTTGLISQVLGINHYQDNNKINAIFKTGILYENWGKKTPKHFHPFLMGRTSIHYSPHLLSKSVIESGLFKIIEKNINDPEKEIDADLIFDCRGGGNRDENLYRDLISPVNSVILANKKGKDSDLHYTKSVATPHGWTFVIPNIDSVSYGYLYNSNITSKKIAEKDFIDTFNVRPDGYLNFKNYVAKNMFFGERTVLNGNRFSFLEPLEATSVAFYEYVSKISWNIVINTASKDQCNHEIQREADRMQNFILWHYSKGSKFDSEFWRYAKKLSEKTFEDDEEFQFILELSKSDSFIKLWDSQEGYSQWPVNSFKNWDAVL
mgnify:CR=1 FL=1